MTYTVIKKYPSYMINEYGDIIDTRTKEKVPISTTKDRGYRVVLDGHMEYLSRVMAETFIVKPTDEHVYVRFKDGNRSNCTLSNIEWATRSRIQRDYIKDDTDSTPKPILDRETGVVHSSIRACARELGMSPVQIRRQLSQNERFELV